jgi:uncharacterized protein YegL
MTQNQTADVIVVLDESGSMKSMGLEPIQSMNALIKKQQERSEDSKFSLYTFSAEIRKVYADVPLSEIKEYSDYNPDGMTSLYDCIGEAIDDKMNSDRKMNTVMIIITDGLDNSSKKYTAVQIKDKTKIQQEKYNWQIIFLAANQDAFASGSALGVGNCSPYDQNVRGGLFNLVRSCSEQVSAYRASSADNFRPQGIAFNPTDNVPVVSSETLFNTPIKQHTQRRASPGAPLKKRY